MRTRPKTRASVLSGLAIWLCVLAVVDGWSPSQAQSRLDETSPVEADVAVDYVAELARVKILIKANVLGLAERILVTQAPPPNLRRNPEQVEIWQEWQRQLWQVYRQQGNWQTLYENASEIFELSANDGLRDEAERVALGALIALGQGQTARAELRRALLSTADESQRQALRQLMVESYLVDDLLAEAQLAMQQFQHDYPSQALDWLLIRARIFIQLGQTDAAVNLLAPLNDTEARLLRIYARLKNTSLKPTQAVKQINNLEVEKTAPQLRRPALAILSVAYRQSDNPSAEVVALEDYFSAPQRGRALFDKALPDLSVGDLVAAYQAAARARATELGLLLGEDRKWLSVAKKMPRDAVEKRALYASVTLEALGDTARQSAADALVGALIDIDKTDLIYQLFGRAAPLGALSLSGKVAIRLSNHAMQQGDTQLAAQINENLSELPRGIQEADWMLHSARIAIIAGQYEKGHSQLNAWLDLAAHSKLQPAQVDRVLQPIFDLQAVQQHALALPLLQKIKPRLRAPRQQREMEYWLGESYFGQEQYLSAADYFLNSALQKDNGTDQWGLSAKFKAAEALMQAGLFDDAQALFEELLERAEQQNHKTALEQKLQQLWLKKSSVHSNAALSG